METRLGQRSMAIIFGVAAGLGLVVLIALGSRGFHWFDSALIGYAVASIFALAAVTYKYTFWLMRPQTGRYFWRSWQLFLSLQNFKRYTTLIPLAILDLFTQQFIRRRAWYRWVTHQCILHLRSPSVESSNRRRSPQADQPPKKRRSRAILVIHSAAPARYRQYQ